MNQGLLKSYKAQLEKLKAYLRENLNQLSEDEVNQLLERTGSLVELIEMLEKS
jgi:hypothetical protein